MLWHLTSSRRFYALALEAHGWVLSKQDPAYPGGERFLASGRTPGFPVGRPHQVRVTQAGATITVHADGHLLTRFTDTQHPYLAGFAGPVLRRFAGPVHRHSRDPGRGRDAESGGRAAGRAGPAGPAHRAEPAAVTARAAVRT